MSKMLTLAPESLFWYWISERHSIYLKRQAGLPKPWTNDTILQQYKFTNPFRENDRGTVWLRENFLQPHANDPLELIAFNICWYRMFNWYGTGQRLGWQTEWNTEKIINELSIVLINGEQVFTGAHIVYSPPGVPKVDAIVDVCRDLYELCTKEDGTLGALYTIPKIARDYNSLQKVFEQLKAVHCVGGFMAYEMVSDMRHTKLLENATDIMTWANPGPGCKRGLQRLGMLYSRDEDAIRSMQKLLEDSKYRFAINAGGSELGNLPENFPDLEMRDIEHSLCEFDKYSRVKFGEGYPRGRFNGV